MSKIVSSFVAGATTLALRGIFEVAAPLEARKAMGTFLFLVGSSVTTAMLAPLVFSALRRIESLSSNARREEGRVTS